MEVPVSHLKSLGTPEQYEKMEQLNAQDYRFSARLSIAYAAVVLFKPVVRSHSVGITLDLWVFPLDGRILHNPSSTTITV